MSKPTIAIDLDNVLSQSAAGFVTFSNKHFGTRVTIQDYSEDWETMWGVSFEEAMRRGAEMRAHQIHLTYLPIKGAFEVLQHLKKRYHLSILTSRRQVVELVTTEWLERYYPDTFEQVLFSGIWDDETKRGIHLLTKGDQYVAMHADYVIDDHLKHCAAAAEKEIPAILFGNFPWNQHDTLPRGVTRCIDWAAVLEYFDGK